MTLATQIVHWPGKDVFVCDQHAIQVRKIAAAMGFTVSSTIALNYQIPCEHCSKDNPLEPIADVIEREFPEEADKIKNCPVPRFLSGKTREQLWHEECDESLRLNRRS